MGIMNELAEVIALLIPDSLALGVGASVFFGVYGGARTLGLFEAQGTDWSFVFSLLVGYAAAVAFNVASSLVSPSSAKASDLCRLESGVGQQVPRLSDRKPVRARCSEESQDASDASPRYSE